MTQPRLRRAAIAAEIRAELARKQLTIKALSEASGIKPDTLRRRLDGVRPFTTDELDRITHYLAVPLITLIERAEANRG